VEQLIAALDTRVMASSVGGWIGAGVLLADVTTAGVVFATTDTEGGNIRAPGMVGR
jgi:hypothetical protein